MKTDLLFVLERLLLFFEKYPLDLVAHLSSSLPIIAGFLNYRFLSKNLKLILYLFLFLFAKDTYALVHMFLIPDINYIQNLEVIVETIVVGSIFFASFDKPIHKNLIIAFTLIGSIVAIIFYKGTDVSSISLTFFRSFSIIFSLTYFNKILTDMRVNTITEHSMFWFTSGLFIYAAGTFFIFLFSEYVYNPEKTSTELFDKFWNVGQVLFIIFCLLTAYGFGVSKYDQENFM